MTSINAALSVYAEVPPYCVEAVQTGHFPDSVDARKLLQERRASLKEFFTLGSKAAACILYSEVPKAHWRISTSTIELRKDTIAKLKCVVQNQIRDSSIAPIRD